MAEFKFNCPQCGQEIEADESARGQVAECPHCEKGIVVPSKKLNTQVQHSNLSTSGRIKIVDQGEYHQKRKLENAIHVSKRQDVEFFSPSLLEWLYWFFNILHLIGCLILVIYFLRLSSDSFCVWYAVGIIVIVFPLGLFQIRIWYEFLVSIFETVRHLREIRDELKKQGMEKSRKG